MNKIIEVKGANQILTVYDNAISLKPKGAIGFLTQGISGERFIYYKELSSIQFQKSSTLLSGYIEFYFAGHNSTKQGGGLFLGTTNENRFYFHNKQLSEALKTKEYIEKQLNNKNEKKSTTNSISSADEIAKYKKLLDDEIITAEEFEAKKKQLLGL